MRSPSSQIGRSMRLIIRPGQTLLEGIIAIAVVTIGLMGVVGLAISNQTSAQAISDRAVATTLAREGLEVTKHIRDSNWLANVPFSTGLLNPVGGFTTAVPSSDFGNPTGPVWSLSFGEYTNFVDLATQVTWLDEGLRYAQSINGGTPTKFQRYLKMTALCRPAAYQGTEFRYNAASSATCASGEKLVGIRVLSHVQWPRGAGFSTVTLELRLFDWR
jgi:hypothetical protein